MTNPPKVFISYSHDSVAHQERVLDLADRLRADGIDAEIDQYNDAPPEGWPRWCERQVEAADFVLMVCTETYHRRVKGDEAPGKGLGAVWEAAIIRQFIYEVGKISSKFVPILFTDGSPEHIPLPIKGWSRYVVDSQDGYEGLYGRLSGQPLTPRPVLAAEMRARSPRKRRWVNGPSQVALSPLPSQPAARILVIGQTCYDNIIWPPDKNGECVKKSRIGGSVYYVTKAVRHIADIMHTDTAIDVWASIGSDDVLNPDSLFGGQTIRPFFVKTGGRTLRFENRYTSERDWTKRQQRVLRLPGERGKLQSVDLPQPITSSLNSGLYDLALLLPLTPLDFRDIAGDMVPALKAGDNKIRIGLELQGLVRDVTKELAPVGRRISNVVVPLLKQHAVCCIHANIDEALFLIKGLEEVQGNVFDLTEEEPGRIARRLCRLGIQYVGITDGGRGSWVAWRDEETGRIYDQYCPTPNITEIVKTPHATGAGDTWFGVFTYALFCRGFDPISAGLLATQFATLKCMKDGALGEEINE